MADSVLGMFTARVRARAEQEQSDRRMRIAMRAVEHNQQRRDANRAAAEAALRAGNKNLAAQYALEGRSDRIAESMLVSAALERHATRIKY